MFLQFLQVSLLKESAESLLKMPQTHKWHVLRMIWIFKIVPKQTGTQCSLYKPVSTWRSAHMKKLQTPPLDDNQS